MPTPPAGQSNYGDGPTPPQTVDAKSPTIWVQRTFPLGKGESFEEQNLEARLFVTQPAVVKASLSRTINLGNYESIRIEVGVELPCYAEEAQQGVDEATAMVGRLIIDEERALRHAYPTKS